jgi:predicted phage tail protein
VDKQSFEQWFMSNLDMMAELGIMHYNSPWGRTVRLSLAVNAPLIEALSTRVDVLERALAQALEQIEAKTQKVEAEVTPEPVPKTRRTRKKKAEVDDE